MNTKRHHLVDEMYAYYLDAHSLADVGVKYHYTESAVHKIFKYYRLPRRPQSKRVEGKVRR